MRHPIKSGFKHQSTNKRLKVEKDDGIAEEDVDVSLIDHQPMIS